MFKDIDFKRALQELPEKEKDKLILRLLRRDMDLAEKLYFELVDTDSIEDKRRIMEMNISQQHHFRFQIFMQVLAPPMWCQVS